MSLQPAVARTDSAHEIDWVNAIGISVFHLLALLAVFPAFFSWTGLPWSLFHMEALEFYGRVNLLKGGIVFARRVTTVSPSYAEEIQTPEFGMGLDGVLRRHAGKLRGILNGLDTEVFDPGKDPPPTPGRTPRGRPGPRRPSGRGRGLGPPSSPTWAAWITRRAWTSS